MCFSLTGPPPSSSCLISIGCFETPPGCHARPKPSHEIVGVENGYDEVNVQIPAKYKYVFPQQIMLGQENVEADRALTEAQSLSTYMARSLRSDRARIRLGRYELSPKLGRYVTTELSPKLGCYVATEPYTCSVAT
ncbi:hypothetical protein DY000_02041339 [Brassica cretica]|uniref:Uncharacterized protein n=1 Tax=Brassica cretica TaxID=69181 RepID=A0ABQ7B7R7_BRACR|nr:hypothetical protein DY000_02041339 [Brassica cretica]